MRVIESPDNGDEGGLAHPGRQDGACAKAPEVGGLAVTRSGSRVVRPEATATAA